MPLNEITQEILDGLMNESIGSAEISDEKMYDRTMATFAGPGNCPTTTVLPTYGRC